MIDHRMICSSQDHIRTGTCDLNHPILIGVENNDKKCQAKNLLMFSRSYSIYV
jgi:hypothetical protein